MSEATSRPRALITGASSGIGEAFARRLAKRGHDLVLVARRRDRMEKLAAQLSEAHGVEAEVVEADLADDSAVATVEERLRRGDIDLLVNDAGFATRGEFAGLPLARELEELDVNVRALMRLSHAALGPMVERGRGAVINVASVGAFQPVPHMATYAATKAFVLHFSEALHEEVKGKGVTVTCLCPGAVKTEFQQVAGVDEGRLRAWKSADDVVESALKAASARRAITVPGALNVAAMAAVKLMPRFVARRIAGSMFKQEK
ncbi:MAG: SDR family oxidoreductase [Dehalococcoidia bacterium]|nr:SDR family oxidoreductase [Dehalococcoidia bacterium]